MAFLLGAALLVAGGFAFTFYQQRNAFRLRCYLIEQKHVYGVPVDRAIAAQLYRDHSLGWWALTTSSEHLARWRAVASTLESQTILLGGASDSARAAFWDKPLYPRIANYKHESMPATYDPLTGHYDFESFWLTESFNVPERYHAAGQATADEFWESFDGFTAAIPAHLKDAGSKEQMRIVLLTAILGTGLSYVRFIDNSAAAEAVRDRTLNFLQARGLPLADILMFEGLESAPGDDLTKAFAIGAVVMERAPLNYRIVPLQVNSTRAIGAFLLGDARMLWRRLGDSLLEEGLVKEVNSRPERPPLVAAT